MSHLSGPFKSILRIIFFDKIQNIPEYVELLSIYNLSIISAETSLGLHNKTLQKLLGMLAHTLNPSIGEQRQLKASWCIE